MYNKRSDTSRGTVPAVVVAALGRLGARAAGVPAGRHPGRRRRAAGRRRRLGPAGRTRHLRLHGGRGTTDTRVPISYPTSPTRLRVVAGRVLTCGVAVRAGAGGRAARGGALRAGAVRGGRGGRGGLLRGAGLRGGGAAGGAGAGGGAGGAVLHAGVHGVAGAAAAAAPPAARAAGAPAPPPPLHGAGHAHEPQVSAAYYDDA